MRLASGFRRIGLIIGAIGFVGALFSKGFLVLLAIGAGMAVGSFFLGSAIDAAEETRQSIEDSEETE